MDGQQGPGAAATAAYDVLEVRCSMQTVVAGQHVRPPALSVAGRARSGRQLVAPLATAPSKDGAAGAGLHTQPKAVGLRATAVVRLEGALAHDGLALGWPGSRADQGGAESPACTPGDGDRCRCSPWAARPTYDDAPRGHRHLQGTDPFGEGQTASDRSAAPRHAVPGQVLDVDPCGPSGSAVSVHPGSNRTRHRGCPTAPLRAVARAAGPALGLVHGSVHRLWTCLWTVGRVPRQATGSLPALDPCAPVHRPVRAAGPLRAEDPCDRARPRHDRSHCHARR